MDAKYTTTMIPVNARKCNIILLCRHLKRRHLKSSDLIRHYYNYVHGLDTFQLECNCCHKRGECIRHAYYERGYFLTKEDLALGTTIRILRVICKSCGHTHAILPEEIVPYIRFTIPFITQVLDPYFSHAQTVVGICEDSWISISTLYSWKERFETHKDQFLGLLKSSQHTCAAAIAWLNNLKDYVVDFADRFLRKVGKMPMQFHANPTNTRRPVFS